MAVRTIYFEDLVENVEVWSEEFAVDKAEMLEYSLRNDPWPFHTDAEAAKASPYGEIIASGGFIVTLMYRAAHTICNNSKEAWAFLGGFEWQVKFHKPVKAGDKLRNKMTVFEKRPSSKPGRGLTKVRHELINQDDQVVFTCEALVLLATRSAS